MRNRSYAFVLAGPHAENQTRYERARWIDEHNDVSAY
jgi:hypothetical protein